MTRLLTLTVLASLAGCVSSAKTDYARHLSAAVRLDTTPSNDVSVAFNLDAYRTQPVAQRDRE